MLMVVLVNFSAPVQGTIEAHRESMQRLEDKKKREAQSTLSREILLKRRRQEAAKAKSKSNVQAAPTKKRQPVSDPPPPARELENMDSDEDGDENLDEGEEWTITDHAVDTQDGEPKFQAITGSRRDGSKKTSWGSYKNLHQDGVLGLDDYIRVNCKHPVFMSGVPQKKMKGNQNKEPKEAAIKVRAPCNHAVYDGNSYKDETNAGYCKDKYCLFGVTCGNNCGAAFVARAAARQQGSGAAVPTSVAPAHCCLNIQNCGHAICDPCWCRGIISQPRRSRGASGS
jgi:hypothetical protein